MEVDTALEHKLQRMQAHPWHGINPTVEDGFMVFVETPPFSPMRYEVDGATGLLKVDHPQETTSAPPAAYGFVPRTFCGPKVAQLNKRLRGDRAALDVFILSERPINVPGVLARVTIIGGIPVKDEGFVDDKLIAVLTRDPVFGQMRDVAEVPVFVLDRLCHFLKEESSASAVDVGDPFGHERAAVLLRAAMDDYSNRYPTD